MGGSLAKFDRDAFRRALSAPLIERLPRMITRGRSGLFVYQGARALRGIGRGVASAFGGNVRIVELASEPLGVREGWQLLEPLLRGETLVLIHDGESTIPGRLAAYWPRYVNNPHGYLGAVAENLVLNSSLRLESAGALVVVQTAGGRQVAGGEMDVWPMLEKEAEEFERAGSGLETPIVVVGRPSAASREPATVKDLGDVTSHMPYEWAYRIYRRVVNHLLGATSEGWAAVSLADTALRSRDETQVLLQAQAHDLRPAIESVWDSVKKMRSVTLELSGGRHDDDPLPDVYAAALSMRMGGDWRSEPERSLYRGQRNNKWRVIPTLYRPGGDGAAADVASSLRRVSSFSRHLRSTYDSFSDDQCMAVAQHFGKEAQTRTPLIDVTWDALVALFFASDGARDGEVGVVDHLVVPEWRKLVASSSQERGFIKVIEVDGVERIARQRAMFLATPDPDAYERYMPYRIWFKQHEGMVFEDEEYEQPISARALYPIDDPMRVVLDRFAEEASPAADVPAIAGPTTNEVFGADYLLERARAMAPSMPAWDTFSVAVLKTCAELLARGPEWSNDPTMHSLHRWEECVNLIDGEAGSGRRCPVKKVLRFTLGRVDDDRGYDIVALAKRVWQGLYETPPGVVAGRLAELLELTSRSGHTAAVCFAGPDSHVVTVLAALAKDARWTLMDLRDLSDEEIMSALERVAQPAVLVVATDATTRLSTVVRLLLRIARDGEGQVTFGGRRLVLHPETRVALVTWGRSFEDDNEARQMVDAWDEVDEFEG